MMTIKNQMRKLPPGEIFHPLLTDSCRCIIVIPRIFFLVGDVIKNKGKGEDVLVVAVVVFQDRVMVVLLHGVGGGESVQLLHGGD